MTAEHDERIVDSPEVDGHERFVTLRQLVELVQRSLPTSNEEERTDERR